MQKMSPPNDGEYREPPSALKGFGKSTFIAAVSLVGGFLLAGGAKSLAELIQPTPETVSAGSIIQTGEKKNIHGVDISLDGWTLKINEEQSKKAIKGSHGRKVEFTILTNSGQEMPLFENHTELGVYELVPKDLRPFAGELIEAGESLGLIEKPGTGMNNNTGFYSDGDNFSVDLEPNRDDRQYVLQIRISDLKTERPESYEFYPLNVKRFHYDQSLSPKDKNLVDITSEFPLSPSIQQSLMTTLEDSGSFFQKIVIRKNRDEGVWIFNSDNRIGIEVSDTSDKTFQGLLPHIRAAAWSGLAADFHNSNTQESFLINKSFLELTNKTTGISPIYKGKYYLDPLTKVGRVLDINTYVQQPLYKRDDSSIVFGPSALIGNIITIQKTYPDELRKRMSQLTQKEEKKIQPVLDIAEKISGAVK
jgi:hypothetical protein